MARKAHGTVTVQKPGEKPRTMPATHWHVEDQFNYLKKQGYKLVTNTPQPVEAKAKGRKKADHIEEETAE